MAWKQGLPVATATAATTTTISATTATTATRVRLGLIDAQAAALEVEAIQSFHSAFCFGIVGHFNKAEAF